MVNLPAPAPRTVIEAFLPAQGEAPLDLVYDTANAAGLDDQPVRLTIRRMHAAGEITQTGRGRRGTIGLTDTGRERLDRDRLGLRLAIAQDHGRAPWDGTWRLLAVSVPEADRALRDALRRTLVEAGAAAVSTSLYVSPHDLTGMLGPAARGSLVRATATSLDVRGLTDPRAVAASLWPAAPIIDAYAALERAVAETDPAPGDGVMPLLVRQIRLADALERAMRDDPLVPLELRDVPWPPSPIRRAWYDRWNTLVGRLPEEILYRGWL
jgi:phenylacetic acid degradation operon negative regulatory protein